MLITLYTVQLKLVVYSFILLRQLIAWHRRMHMRLLHISCIDRVVAWSKMTAQYPAFYMLLTIYFCTCYAWSGVEEVMPAPRPSSRRLHRRCRFLGPYDDEIADQGCCCVLRRLHI